MLICLFVSIFESIASLVGKTGKMTYLILHNLIIKIYRAIVFCGKGNTLCFLANYCKSKIMCLN